MDNEVLRKRLDIWKRILLIETGAAFTLLATSIADIPNLSKPYFPGWYGVWFVILIASLFPGFILLLGKHWMQIFIQERLNTIFGFFAITWINFFAVGIRSGPASSSEFNYFLLVSAIAIAVGYWWLRRKFLSSRGDIFP
jgi:hypothetical protein